MRREGTVRCVETVVAADDEAFPRRNVLPAVARLSATWLAPTSPAPTWIGVVIIAVGFAVIAYGWSRVAGLLSVPLQMPYMISAGFTGLGLICVGVGVVAVQAKRRETAARERHLDEIRELVQRLDRHIGAAPETGRSEGV